MERSKKYWIDGNGQSHASDRGHLAAVLERPESFGRTQEELEAIFCRCGEPVGAEGIARTLVLEQVVRSGWMQAAYDSAKDRCVLTLWDVPRRRAREAVDRFVDESLAAGVAGPETRLELRTVRWGGTGTPPGMAEPPPLTFERWQRVSAIPLETVSLDHDGRTVTGEITFRTGSDISVRITRPYRLLEAGVHIPYFGRPYRDYRTSYGEETSRWLLKEIYDRARLIETRQEELLGRLADFRALLVDLAERMPLAADQEAYLLCRRALRTDRQSGKIDRPAFEREVRRMRKDLVAFRVAQAEAWAETLGRRLGVQYFDEADDVIDLLEGREALRA